MPSRALGVAQWTECQPVNQGVTGLIPHLGCMAGFRAGQPHIDVSLPLFLPPFPSLKMNK